MLETSDFEVHLQERKEKREKKRTDRQTERGLCVCVFLNFFYVSLRNTMCGKTKSDICAVCEFKISFEASERIFMFGYVISNDF